MLTESELTGCIESRRASLTRLAAAMLGDAWEAEDALQESALKAFRAREGFRSEADVCTWFQRILVNSVNEVARRRVSETGRREALRQASVGGPGYTADPEALALWLEDVRRLADAMDTLSRDQRLAVVLHDLEGWRSREIAEETGQPLATVKSHLRRGRLALVAHLA